MSIQSERYDRYSQKIKPGKLLPGFFYIGFSCSICLYYLVYFNDLVASPILNPL